MTQTAPALYQHRRRPEWGVAVLAWERDGKRAYLFESGMLKVLAEPFFELMAPTDDTGEDSNALVQRLAKHLDSSDPARSMAKGASTLHFNLDDQVALFRGEFPDGFADEAWLKKQRGGEPQRRLKRHRNPAVEDARTRLSKEELTRFASEQQYTEAWTVVADVLDATDLVPASQVKALRNHPERATAQSVTALQNLLYGEGEFAASFDEFMKHLRQLFGSAPSWEAATALLTLIHPEVHVCVRRTSFQKQADWRLANLGTTTRPNSAAYMAFLDLATAVFEDLKKAGVEPQDLLDVHDFVKLTTSPSSQRRMHAVKHAIARGTSGEHKIADA